MRCNRFPRVFTLAVVAMATLPTMLVTTSATTPAYAGLVLHYDFDETTGTTAADASGNGNTGTLNNMSFDAASATGVFGNGLRFGSSTNDYLEVTNAANLPTTGDDFTMVFHLADDDWDAWNDFSRNEILADYAINSIKWNLALKQGDLLVATDFGSNTQGIFPVATQPGVVDAQFAHIAVTFTSAGGIGTVYINGSPVAETGDSAFSFENSFGLGNRLDGTPNDVADGVYDDFAIFDQVLSQSVIQSIMTDGVAGGGNIPIPEPSTFLIWALGLVALAWYGWRRRRN